MKEQDTRLSLEHHCKGVARTARVVSDRASINRPLKSSKDH